MELPGSWELARWPHKIMTRYLLNLVGGLEHLDYCSIYIYIYGNVIIPTDELIFFRGVGIPPTRNGTAAPNTSESPFGPFACS